MSPAGLGPHRIQGVAAAAAERPEARPQAACGRLVVVVVWEGRGAVERGRSRMGGGGGGLFSAVCMEEEEEEGGGKRVGLRW